MKELERTRVGQFSIENSISLEQIETNSKTIEKHLITMEHFFSDKEAITLSEKQLTLLLNGVLLNTQKPDDIYRIYDKNHQFIGCGVCKNQKLKRDIILYQ